MDKLVDDNFDFAAWAKRMEAKHGTFEKKPVREISNQEKVAKETDLFERVKRQRFDNYIIGSGDLKGAVALCKKFARDCDSKGLMLLGSTGAGKTHLATAVCGEMMKKGLIVREVKYLKMVSEIRGLTMDYEDRIREMSKYKNPRVLYIDDLFKGGVTPMEVKILFEIIDHRYSNGRITIVTSEKTLEELDKIGDGEVEAVKSRLLEMTEGYFYEFKNTKNYRDLTAFNKQKKILEGLNIEGI